MIKAIRNRKSSSKYFVKGVVLAIAGILLVTGLAACASPSAGPDATEVVTKHLEAKKNNDYDAWLSTMTEERRGGFTKEQNGDFGVISLTVDKVEPSPEETQRYIERMQGSELAQSLGWSDEYIAHNVTVVTASYTVDYDNTKVPDNDGTKEQLFYLAREAEGSPWLVWDWMSA